MNSQSREEISFFELTYRKKNTDSIEHIQKKTNDPLIIILCGFFFSLRCTFEENNEKQKFLKKNDTNEHKHKDLIFLYTIKITRKESSIIQMSYFLSVDGLEITVVDLFFNC